MSEQEIDLDAAISLFRLVINFDEYKEGLREVLTKCHTNEELERAKTVIEEEKQRLMTENPEFKEIMDRRQQENKTRIEHDRAIHQARMSEAKSDASRATTDAMSKTQGAMSAPDIEGWVAKTRFKTVDPDELEKRIEEGLWCPISKTQDKHNNLIDGVASCMKCMHRLVPKSELKDYPRKYRRAWKRRKK